METKKVISALAALAQETRLSIFRLLVETGPAGLAVGSVAEKLDLANATLSFHLKELTNAGLTVATQNGRSINYSADFTTMLLVVDYLTENCCSGAADVPCTPLKLSAAGCAPAKVQKKASATISKSVLKSIPKSMPKSISKSIRRKP